MVTVPLYLDVDQVKQIIMLIGMLDHPDALKNLERKSLADIQRYLAEKIDEEDHAWKIHAEA